jgi:hypothetical protein
MKRILASNLWPMLTSESGNTRLARMLEQVEPSVKALLEALVLYDEVVLPTQDFTAVPALITLLGEHEFRAVLDSGALRFVRVQGTMVLGASGLEQARVYRENGEPHPFAADLDWTLQWACDDFARALNPREMAKAIELVTSELSAGDVVNAIKAEVAADLTNSSALRDALGAPAVDFRRLRADQVHLYGGPRLPSEVPGVDAFLRAAQCNAEMHIATQSGCDDIASSTEIDAVIRAKLSRGPHGDVGERLLEIASVPDFAALILAGEVPLSAILKLRASRDGVAFRKWLHESIVSTDTVEIAKAYAGLLRNTDVVDGGKGRVVRALLWTAVSAPTGLAAGGLAGLAIGAAAGLATSLVDSFVVSKVRLQSSPLVFLDRLRETAKRS